jgi:predicted nucleic acid-binding protein
MALCLDANVFIQASRVRYPMDISPGFWDALLDAAERGVVFSIAAVYDELKDSDDELAAWVKTHHAALFRANSDKETQDALVLVGNILETRLPAYRDEAKEAFLRVADPWLVAYCKAHGHTLVTEEVEAPQSVKDVKIPDIYEPLGVPTMTMLGMLRAAKVKLVSG